MKCPFCQGNNVRLNGKLPSGNQRYFCKDCNKGFSKNTILIKPVITHKCPYCQGELRKAGYNRSGTERYVCKKCGKKCSRKNEKELHEPIFKYIEDKECPHCHSNRIKKAGKNKGKQRFKCLDCDKIFSDATVIREELNIICPKCEKDRITRCGHNSNGTQRYRCKDCGHKFSTEKSYKPFKPYEKKCPVCGYMYAKKAGRSGKGSYSQRKQYFKCCECGHKFLENGIFYHLTEKDKNLIYKFGVLLNVPAIYIAKHIGCSEKSVRNVLKDYERLPKVKYQRTEMDIKQDNYILNSFICKDTIESINRTKILN